MAGVHPPEEPPAFLVGGSKRAVPYDQGHERMSRFADDQPSTENVSSRGPDQQRALADIRRCLITLVRENRVQQSLTRGRKFEQAHQDLPGSQDVSFGDIIHSGPRVSEFPRVPFLHTCDDAHEFAGVAEVVHRICGRSTQRHDGSHRRPSRPAVGTVGSGRAARHHDLGAPRPSRRGEAGISTSAGPSARQEFADRAQPLGRELAMQRVPGGKLDHLIRARTQPIPISTEHNRARRLGE